MSYIFIILPKNAANIITKNQNIIKYIVCRHTEIYNNWHVILNLLLIFIIGHYLKNHFQKYYQNRNPKT